MVGYSDLGEAPLDFNDRFSDFRPSDININANVLPDLVSRISHSAQSYMTLLEKSRFFSNAKNLILLEKYANCASSDEIKLEYHLSTRNRIIDLWISNKGQQLSDEDILGVFGNNEYAISVFKFLNINGIINYGTSNYSIVNYLSKNLQSKVVIIGAGLSGLIAAKQLQKYNFDVVILEAKRVIGGRMTCFTQLFDDSQEYIADLGGHITYSGNSLDPLDIIIKQLNLKFKDRIEMDNEAILDVTSRIIPNSIVKSYISFMKAMLESYLIYCEKHNMHAISFRKFFESAIKKQHCTNLELDLEFTKEMYNFYSIGIKKLTMLKQLQREINSIKLELLSIEKSGVGKNVVEAYHSRKLRLELADKEKIYANLYYEFDKVNLSKNNLDNSKSDLIDLIDFEQIKIFLSILMSYELNGGFDFENVSPQFIGQTFFAETNVDCSGKEFMDCLLADQKTLNIKTACKVQSVCYMNNVNNPDLPSCRLSYRNLDNDDIEFIESDYVLTTIPLNVLKSNPSIFLPPLPDWKLEIINESQPLFTEKIIVFLQKRLWPNKKMKKVNSISAESSHGMGQIKLIFDKNMPVVEVLYRHHESKFADSFDKESILSHISSLIKTITRQNPIIKSSVFTNWRNDPFSLGSSSTMPVRCREIGPLTLGCPIKNSYGKNSLFFGGDSTSVNYFGRTRGAIESGLVQASEILNETYYGHY